MTTLVADSSRPILIADTGTPVLSVSAVTLFAEASGENNVNLSVDSTVVNLVASPERQIELEATADQVVLVVSTGATSSGTDVNGVLVALEWDTPGSESANTIEIAGSILAYDGSLLVSSLVDVQIVVTDGAADGEPSATAYLTAASSPVGTVLAGSGTATLIIRSANGQLSIAVHEASAGHRFLWVSGAGHERLWVRAQDGVQELVFA